MRITVDSDMGNKLTQVGESAEICDASGRTIGYFSPAAPSGRLKDLSPYSDEDIERFSQEEEGRPLADIWKDLEGRHGT